nr:uncharacterized protein LOC100184225 [Ciona intestinalis]|eukprot:XP_002124752.2 uncharacterized protein LOC100184225 [Ciona intestinalis]
MFVPIRIVVLACLAMPVTCFAVSLDSWSTWSSCSVTCGSGVATRRWKCSGINCEQKVETKECFPEFCPSYLSWPRIHFGGTLVMDANTINNKRCNYQNEYFSNIAAKIKEKSISVVNDKYTHYMFRINNWNPDGSGHVYFMNSTVKSICTGPSQCSTTDTIVGSVFKEITRGQLATIDPDWQVTVEVWGLTVQIPGVLKGRLRPGSVQQEGGRVMHANKKIKGYAIGGLGRFKTKVENITWESSHYKSMFNNAEELSMIYVIDLFNQFSFSCRMVGTLGLTSPDDPNEITAGRMLKSTIHAIPTPFFVNYKKKVITMDFSGSFHGKMNGHINSQGVDLAIKINCRYPLIYPPNVCPHGHHKVGSTTVYYITRNGDLSSKYFGTNMDWYFKYGGIVDVDISHLSLRWRNLIKFHELILLRAGRGFETIIAKEYMKGITIGVSNQLAMRLNNGQTKKYIAYASRFNKPMPGVEMKFTNVPMNATTDCNRPDTCKLPLSLPADVIHTSSNTSLTNYEGKMIFNISALKSPGNPRGCGLDGQLYILMLEMSCTIGGYKYTFKNGQFGGTLLHKMVHPSEFVLTLAPLVRIYNEVEVKECPTWQDIKGILTQYYNLYPVMSKNGIINLHNYMEVKQKSQLIRIAMFQTDFEDPKYMPASRDLSLSKQKLIWNWMQCGMKYGNETEDKDVCHPSVVGENMKKLKLYLQKAVNLELTTIPPYFTAWLSLQTEYARNLKVARQIKSIYTEEMLHMSIAANILNSIGGTVNLTNIEEIPIYPTKLGSGSFFELAPGLQVTLQKFSKGLIKDIFMEIELPSPDRDRKDFKQIVGLWKRLPVQGSGGTISTNMDQLLQEFEGEVVDESYDDNQETLGATEKLQLQRKWERVKNHASKMLKISPYGINTIGSLYTKITLFLTALESCAKIDGLNNIGPGTIFVGDPIKQLNMSYWYNPAMVSDLKTVSKFWSSEMSKEELVLNERQTSFKIKRVERDSFPPGSDLVSPLFPITDLKSAIQGVVEIIYQGEGGSPCSPFKSTKPGGTLSLQTSHYVRFMEIVHGRTLGSNEKTIG